MIRHTKRETLKLTPQLAKEFATMKAMRGERPLSPRRIEHFEKLIQESAFHSPVWATVALDGTLYRADGQHTSTVLASLPKKMTSVVGELTEVAFPPGLEVTIDRFEVDEPAQLDEIFERFNGPYSVRTNSDKLSYYVAQHDDLQGIDVRIAACALAGVAEAKQPKRAAKTPLFADLAVSTLPKSRDRGGLLKAEEVRQFLLWMAGFGGTRHSMPGGVSAGLMTKPGLVAEMFIDWEADPEIATVFWGHAFRDDHPDTDHETRMLVDAVQESKGKKGKSTSFYRKLASKMWKRHLRGMAEAA